MPDTGAAAAKTTKRWEQEGYTVQSVYRDGPAVGNGIQIRTDLADGSILIYTAANKVSMVDVAGACRIAPDPND